VEADTVQLKEIMAPERRYVIPTFQRDYEWTRDGQWELLFDDLDALADRLGEARRSAELQGISLAKAEKRVAPHFLGAVVCDQMASSAKEIDVRAVIDGQQRLTTLQLLLRGLLDVLIETDSPRQKAVRRLLENPEDVVHRPHEKHKLWPRRRDREVWPTAMADEIPLPGSDRKHRYLEAREFFSIKVRESIKAVDGTDRTDDLVDAVLDLFKLVMIDLGDHDDAQVIFEVLNGRQTPLSASDLVKNLLFLRGELSDEKEMDALYEQYWAPFDDEWWTTRVGSGHAARAHRDVLLSVWLTAASGSEANVGHLYGEVRAYLAGDERKTEDVLGEIADYGRAYQTFYGRLPAGSPALAVTYGRLNVLRMSTAVPLLAWLQTLPVSMLSLPDHERAARAVESWVVRRTFVSANTRGHNVAFMAVLRAGINAAADPDLNVADAIVAAFRRAPNSLSWPTDENLKSAFVNDSYYGRFTQERIRMLLGAIDDRLRQENPHTEPGTFDYTRLQIEHVMPRSWKTHWPIKSDEDADYSATWSAEWRRQACVDKIGNLTLVTATFNKSVSNQGWLVKRPALAAQSALQLNVSLASSQAWNEETITARSIELAEVASRVWPTNL
jgi:hypothetical protein